MARADDGTLVVEVTGRGGRRLGGVGVYRHLGDARWERVGRTEPDGTLTLLAAPGRDEWQLTADAYEHGPTIDVDHPRPTHPALGPRVKIPIDCGADVTLDVVDAETGDVLPGARWRARGEVSHDAPGPWHPTGTPVFLLVGRNGRTLHGVELEGLEPRNATHFIDAPGLRHAVRGLGFLHGAARIRAVVPLRRVVTLVVRPTTPDGKLTPAEYVSAGFTGDEEELTSPDLRRDPPTAATVARRLPYYRGARVHVSASGAAGAGSVEVVLPAVPPTAAVDVPVVLKEVGAGADAPFTPERRGPLQGTGDLAQAIEDPGGAGLDLQVLRKDRKPLPYADVALTLVVPKQGARQPGPVSGRSGTADAEGWIGFRDMPPGRYRLDVHSPGTLPLRRELNLTERGQLVTLEVVEPEGARVEVAVVDGSGAPLPFAKLLVLGPSDWGEEDLGVDPGRADSHADVGGRRTYQRVELGSVRLEASCGPFHGETTVDTTDRATVKATVVVSQPR